MTATGKACRKGLRLLLAPLLDVDGSLRIRDRPKEDGCSKRINPGLALPFRVRGVALNLLLPTTTGTPLQQKGQDLFRNALLSLFGGGRVLFFLLPENSRGILLLLPACLDNLLPRNIKMQLLRLNHL